MKISIEATPEEIVKILTEYSKQSHEIVRKYEEQLASMLLFPQIKNAKKEDKILNPEVPSGGYYQ